MNTGLPIIEKINVTLGAIAAVLSYFLGKHWILFVAFLALNVIDYITGCLKSKINGRTSSTKGAIGALKKLGYWLMILVAFGMSAIFVEIGETIGVNLQFSTMIGWFILCTLIINELRSILENFVEAGYDVPNFLIKGLEVANKALDGKIHIDGTNAEFNKDVSNRSQVTLQLDKSADKKKE